MTCKQVTQTHSGELQFLERTNKTDQQKLPLLYAYFAYNFNHSTKNL